MSTKFSTKLITSKVVTKSDDDLVLTAVISNDVVDRDKESVNQDGIEFDNYMKNPLVLSNHNPMNDPIGRVKSIRREGSQTVADIQFTPENVNPEGYKKYMLYKGGFLNAFSIGFRELEDFIDKGVRELKRIELLELSAVTIPANPDATVLAKYYGGKSNMENNEKLLAEIEALKTVIKEKDDRINKLTDHIIEIASKGDEDVELSEDEVVETPDDGETETETQEETESVEDEITDEKLFEMYYLKERFNL